MKTDLPVTNMSITMITTKSITMIVNTNHNESWTLVNQISRLVHF